MVKFEKNLLIKYSLLIYIVLKPFYFFSSGLPQISDFFILFMLVYLLSKEKRVKLNLDFKINIFIKRIFIFVCYISIVNILYFLLGRFNNNEFYIAIMYYWFNFIMVIYIKLLYDKIGYERIYNQLIKGCNMSASILFFLSFIISNDRVRATVTFNNPNQLGYYSLLLFVVCTIFPIIAKRKNNLIYSIFTLYLIGISLSKAAIIGCICNCAFIFIFVRCNSSIVKKIKIFSAIILLSSAFFLSMDPQNLEKNPTLYGIHVRFSNILNEDDSSLSTGRGYDRIGELNQLFLIGMGEGEYQRFDSLNGLESHSSYVTILVSYGLIGTVMFFYLICTTLRCNKKSIINFIMAFSGIFLYWVTHNGLRNTFVWIIFTVYILIEANSIERDKTYENCSFNGNI